MATVTAIEYSGLIWCPTVSTGAFVARRNGKVFITGNSGFPKSLDVSKAIDKAAGHARATEYEPNHKNGTFGKGMGGGKHGARSDPPVTDAARQWQGWGTALKPALEPITVARKPFASTVAANVLEHGAGALNIDGCRVGERWPANLIHDGSDEVLQAFPQASGAVAPVKGTEASAKTANAFGEYSGRAPSDKRDGGGSAARFFYCAKASKKDRDEGCELIEAGQYSHDGRKTLIDNAYQRNSSRSSNSHPTVKPTELMAYLCRLVTPPGGIVLDPFMGSGSTGKAAVREGFNFIGCELSEEYMQIAKARIQNELDKRFADLF